MHRFFLVLILILSIPVLALASDETPESQKSSFWKEKFSYGGELRQETAYRLSSPHNFTKIKQIAKLHFKFDFNDHLKMKIGGRAFYDAVYDLTDQFPEEVNDNQRKELLLRDAYLDVLYPKVQVRLGHQQIVWGEALAQFFADVVSPLDLREFLLPSFEDVRLMIWAINMQINFAPDAFLELVWVPDSTVDKLPLPGAEFAFNVPPPPPGVEQEILPDQKPPNHFNNGGVRILYYVEGWDLAWFYYTSPDHIPALFKTVSMDPDTGNPLIVVTPEHRRVQHYGFTFNKATASSVFRGEFVLTIGRYFNAKDVTVDEGVTRRNQFRYMIGWDYSIAGKVDMNLEWQEEVTMGPPEELEDPSHREWIFVRFETGFLDETVIPEMIFIVGLNGGDTQISPRLRYNVSDNITLTWGVDIFTGPPDGLYGQFDTSDRVFMNTAWRF